MALDMRGYSQHTASRGTGGFVTYRSTDDDISEMRAANYFNRNDTTGEAPAVMAMMGFIDKQEHRTSGGVPIMFHYDNGTSPAMEWGVVFVNPSTRLLIVSSAAGLTIT